MNIMDQAADKRITEMPEGALRAARCTHRCNALRLVLLSSRATH
jgi:hypothetical protein